MALNKQLAAATIFGFLIVLAGCDKSGDKAGENTAQSQASTSAGSEKSDASEDQLGEKTQAYIKLNNNIDNFTTNTNEAFAKWAARDEEKVKNGDFKAIKTDSDDFSRAIESLKKALAMPGNTNVDAAAKTLADAIEKYLPNWIALEEYNKAKRYEDDNGAKGTEMLPMYQEGIAKVEEALIAFRAKVDQAAKEEHTKTLAKFKADGKLLEMHTLEAMGAAEKIIEMFNDSSDFKDAAKIEKANKLLVEMETSNFAIKAEHEKRVASDKDSLPMLDRYDEVKSELTDFAANYREARKDPSKMNEAIENYNDAIEEYNRMNR